MGHVQRPSGSDVADITYQTKEATISIIMQYVIGMDCPAEVVSAIFARNDEFAVSGGHEDLAERMDQGGTSRLIWPAN